MTKTYNDIEAVTRLLEEKEKDLELTARIGKELLVHNQKLETSVNALEAELKSANEKITQLSHELIKKTELIQILTNDVEESSPEDDTPTGLRHINLDLMQKRITSLEDENKALKFEFTQMVKETDNVEAQEAKLVKDIADQLANANMEVDDFAEELSRQKEENRLQHEQIISLTSKLAETELKLAQLIAEHEDVNATLIITRENQNTLATELADFKDKYAEVVNLLAESQEQLRKHVKKSMPTVRGGGGGFFSSMGAAPQPDSIASELESSLYSEFSLDSGISDHRVPAYKKVFETVRSASRVSYGGGVSSDNQQFPRLSSMTTSTISTGNSGPRMTCRPHIGSGYPSLDSTGQSDSEGSLITDSEEYPGPQPLGVPGAPGAADLEAAIRRLSPQDVISRRANLSIGTGYNFDYDGGVLHSPPIYVPIGCRTPDSIMSTGSYGNLSGFSGNSGGWRLPEKLQIVKPMEGSQTLHQWSLLAKPTLGGLLEDRPGVKTRGDRGLEEFGFKTYTLADFEEDEEYTNPGKLFQGTGSVYTFTNSTVMHPEDPTSITPSLIGSRVVTAPNSALNSGMNTPRMLSRRNSTSTFSTTYGLAKMLNERGIKGGTSSTCSTPSADKNFTPTATPYNSPDGGSSPVSSRPASPVLAADTSSLALGFFSSGAELLKRTLGVESSSPASHSSQQSLPSNKKGKKTSSSQKKSVSSYQIIKNIEKFKIMAVAGSSMAPIPFQGALCVRRPIESPMAHILKGSLSTEKLGSSSISSSTTSDFNFKYRTDEKNDKSNRSNSAGMSRNSQRHRRPGGNTRPDLGQVKSAASTPVTTKSESTSQFALVGSLSSFLFGRKGGLQN